MRVRRRAGALLVASAIAYGVPFGADATTSGGLRELSPGWSTSRHCALEYATAMSPTFGTLQSVNVTITRSQLLVSFHAARRWQLDTVERGGSLQWEFSEWVPHHRPIFNDNHGGTIFSAGTTLEFERRASSQQVYFQTSRRRISGSYWYSPTNVVLAFSADHLAALGVRTPFNWTASFGYEQCVPATER